MLLQAAGEILRTCPADVSMPMIARSANLSTATAYRYFPSLNDLLNDYLHRVIIRLRDYSHGSRVKGPALFEDVVGEWMRLLGLYGPAMVQLRSRTGLLARLRAEDTVIASVRDAWERPIRAVMRGEEIPEPYFEAALFLYNVLFDPREILDLIQSGLASAEVRQRLVAAYKGALRAWAQEAGR